MAAPSTLVPARELPVHSMRTTDTSNMDPAAQEFMGVNFPSLEYSLDMLSEFQPQQPTDLFVPTTSNAPLDFVHDLFPLSPVQAAADQLQESLAELPASPPAQQAVSSSSSGSPAKERKGSRERQSSGRWSTRDKGPVSDARKLEVNREAQRRFRQRQKVLLLQTNSTLLQAALKSHPLTLGPCCRHGLAALRRN